MAFDRAEAAAYVATDSGFGCGRRKEKLFVGDPTEEVTKLGRGAMANQTRGLYLVHGVDHAGGRAGGGEYLDHPRYLDEAGAATTELGGHHCAEQVPSLQRGDGVGREDRVSVDLVGRRCNRFSHRRPRGGNQALGGCLTVWVGGHGHLPRAGESPGGAVASASCASSSCATTTAEAYAPS